MASLQAFCLWAALWTLKTLWHHQVSLQLSGPQPAQWSELSWVSDFALMRRQVREPGALFIRKGFLEGGACRTSGVSGSWSSDRRPHRGEMCKGVDTHMCGGGHVKYVCGGCVCAQACPCVCACTCMCNYMHSGVCAYDTHICVHAGSCVVLVAPHPLSCMVCSPLISQGCSGSHLQSCLLA